MSIKITKNKHRVSNNKTKTVKADKDKNALDTSVKYIAETDEEFENLPANIVPPPEPDVNRIVDRESFYAMQLARVEYYLQRGMSVHRIADLIGESVDRTNLLIEDVYTILWEVGGINNGEKRHRIKQQHEQVLTRIQEQAMAYMYGEKGQLSPSEFATVARTLMETLRQKERINGIGNTVIFEQFNTTQNFNITGGQQHVKDEKEKRVLLEQLHNLLIESKKGVDYMVKD